MSSPTAIVVRLADRRSTLRSACLRGGAAAVRALMAEGPRAAAMLGWIVWRARPGTALSDRILRAVEDLGGGDLVPRLDGGDAGLVAFSSGLAVAECAPGRRPALLADWRAIDAPSLLDFAAVALGLRFGGAGMVVDVLDALDGSRASTRAARPALAELGVAVPATRSRAVRAGALTDAEIAVCLAPEWSRAVLGEVAAARPELLARVLRRVRHDAGPRARIAVPLLAALARRRPDHPVDAEGRTAPAILGRIARRGPHREGLDAWLPAIEACGAAGWRPAPRVAAEWLERGIRPAGAAADDLDDDVNDDAGRPARGGPTRRAAGGRARRRRPPEQRLLRLLAADGRDEALAAIDRAGRRDPSWEVRRVALAELAAALDRSPSSRASRPRAAARLTALARAQLRDPVAAVASPALDAVVRRREPAAAAADVLPALPGMPRSLLPAAAKVLAAGVPVAARPQVVRRLVEAACPLALLVFVDRVAGAGAGADSGSDGGLDVGPAEDDRVLVRHAERDEALRNLVRIEVAIAGQSSLERQQLEAECTVDLSDSERALLRGAAWHLASGRAIVRVRRDARRRRRRAGSRGTADDVAAEHPPVLRPMVGLLLRLLRDDPEGAEAAAALLRTGLRTEQIAPARATQELGMIVDRAPSPAIAAERTRGLWRPAFEGPVVGGSLVAALQWQAAGPRRTPPPPEAYAEIVARATQAMGSSIARGLRSKLPPASSDPAYDARFPVHASGSDGDVPPLHVRIRRELYSAFRRIGVIGHRLLGRGVHVHPVFDCVGCTSPPEPGSPTEVHVSPDPILELGAAGRAAVIGVGIHELGHQLYDFREPGWRREADRLGRLGLHPVQNLLCDERLERRLRSRDAAYGRAIDAAVRHWFVRHVDRLPVAGLAAVSGREEGELRAAIAAGAVPGRLERESAAPDDPPDVLVVRRPELLRVPGLGTPWQVFMWALRTGADRSRVPCGRARAALDLVPAGLRHLDIRRIGGLCERLAEVLGGADAERARRRAMRRLADRNAAAAAILEAVAAAAAAGRADPMGGAGVWPEAPELPAGGDGGDGRDAGDAGDGPAGPGACVVPAGGAVTAIRRRLSAAAASPACPRWWCGDRGRETDFTPLEKEVAVGRRPAEHRAVAGEVRQWIGPLRREFERLGRRDVDEPAARRGRRLDVARARSVALGPRIDLFVGRRELVAADCELGLLVDRSGSMDGPKLALARRFGVLVAEAVRGIRGISGWTAAFDHDTWYELGPFERTAIASLAAGGGNNDAAAVHRAGERLRGSRRRHRALVLVSDGEPTACTVAAFHAEAARLERERGIAVIHVVIDQLEREAVLPRSVDLSGKDFDEAVRRFGRLVADLVRHGGRAVVARPARPAGTAS